VCAKAVKAPSLHLFTVNTQSSFDFWARHWAAAADMANCCLNSRDCLPPPLQTLSAARERLFDSQVRIYACVCGIEACVIIKGQPLVQMSSACMADWSPRRSNCLQDGDALKGQSHSCILVPAAHHIQLPGLCSCLASPAG
jgi:hypothetical protein